MPLMKRAEKIDHLIDTAAELFSRYGYHAAGIDRIIDEAGIAKTTLYRHFGSKEELIIAALRRIDDRYRNDMRLWVDERAPRPADKLLATFDFLETWFAGDDFLGCPFLSAAGEYGERSDPVFQASVLHKRLMLAYFEELAREAGYDQPFQVAQTINPAA